MNRPMLPGFGAVRSAQTIKGLHNILTAAAENFIAHYLTARRFCFEFPKVRGPHELDVVQKARARYLRAKLAYESVLNLAQAA